MQVHDRPALAFYAQPAAMTSAGRYAPLLTSLPRDLPGLATVAQGLLIHEHMAQGYGVTLSEADRASVHLRPVEHLLAQIVARDGRPLHIARTPAGRLPGNCRHFTVLMVAMLRAQGRPAHLMRDAAALCNIELLPWDCWSAMPGPDDPISRDLAALFDRLAALTQQPGGSFAELRQLCEADDRLRVPPAVRNAARNRDEALPAGCA